VDVLAVLTEPVDIRLTDDRSFPLIEVLGPLAVVIAGVVGAWLAARYAETQQERQFAHERAMRERDATRAILDELGRYITTAIDKVSSLAAVVKVLEDLRHEEEAAPDDEERLKLAKRYTQVQQQIIDAQQPAHSALIDGLAWVFRLQLRFEPDDPVLVQFEKWRAAFEKWHTRVVELAMEPWDENDEAELDELGKAAAEALLGFSVAAREWINRSATALG
jgi:hypothetical protein